MRSKNYYIYLEDWEYKQVIASLIDLRNNLIQQGKYTDAVDEVLCKLVNAKKKKMKIKYV